MITIHTDLHRRRDAKTELYGGELVAPFERPSRVDFIVKRVEEVKLGEIVAPQAFCESHFERVHDASFIEFVKTAWQQWRAEGFAGEAIPTVWPARRMVQKVPEFIDGKLGYYAFAGETSISEGTWEAAVASAQVALTGAKHIAEGGNAIFSLCRPPGHHTAVDMYGGYCFLNNAAIAAQYMLDQGASKIAILDVDFHHGNGTQDIFYERSDVLFVSLHGDPAYAFPHFLGYAEETGVGDGQGFNVNYPMGPGTPYDVWRDALKQGLNKITQFAPDALIVSLGVDTFENDPISFFKLKSDDYTDYGRRLGNLALPTLFVMEGGYDVEEIGVNTVNVLQGFEHASS